MRKSNRVAAGAAAWRVVYEGIRPGKPSLWARAGAIPRMLGSRIRGHYTQLPASRLVLFVLAVLYIASPVDLVPELFIPLFGLADDAVIAIWLASGLMSETERFLEWERYGPQYVQGHVVG
ncbi:YkvA family protein [Allosalinactinospora lopnorensis]|uniref:YkvA family protein n=1 Tax=Allosalinactinospora lopnorensis TaxID=1352348 RepID=UPI0009E22E15|nr:YkvA family protein [Allosalinactinospora lopnorensis]